MSITDLAGHVNVRIHFHNMLDTAKWYLSELGIARIESFGGFLSVLRRKDDVFGVVVDIVMDFRWVIRVLLKLIIIGSWTQN